MTIKKPDHGLLTFEAEGHEGGPYHSRKLHVPSDFSGVTIGRGYDCKTKTTARIVLDLRHSGISKDKADVIGKCSGLKGQAAKDFIEHKNLEDFEITQSQQVKLFELVYASILEETKRLCTKDDVTEAYGRCNWDALNPVIREILIDLRFRGDYTPSARRLIQKTVSENDLAGFVAAMVDRSNWVNVPLNRFELRKRYAVQGLLSQTPPVSSTLSLGRAMTP